MWCWMGTASPPWRASLSARDQATATLTLPKKFSFWTIYSPSQLLKYTGGKTGCLCCLNHRVSLHSNSVIYIPCWSCLGEAPGWKHGALRAELHLVLTLSSEGSLLQHHRWRCWGGVCGGLILWVCSFLNEPRVDKKSSLSCIFLAGMLQGHWNKPVWTMKHH